MNETHVPLDYTIPFGKHEGQTVATVVREHPGYAQWAAAHLDEPYLREAFKRALKEVSRPDVVEATAVDIDFEYTLSGGGAKAEGVMITGALAGRYDEDRSATTGTGALGPVTYDVSDGVYEVRRAQGIIGLPPENTFYVAVQDGATYRLERRADAQAVAEGAAITTT